MFFIAGCSSDDNELITLEIIHRYVEQMDKYYGNVCELDIIFSFTKAYYILDELLLAGELQESSKKNVLRCISQQDSLEDMEVGASFFPNPMPCPISSEPWFSLIEWRLWCLYAGLADRLVPLRLRTKSPRSCRRSSEAVSSPIPFLPSVTASRTLSADNELSWHND